MKAFAKCVLAFVSVACKVESQLLSVFLRNRQVLKAF